MRKADKEERAMKNVGVVLGGGEIDDRPMLALESEMLKEIKDWKVGEKYRLVLEVELDTLHKEDKKEVCGHFKVNKVEAYG